MGVPALLLHGVRYRDKPGLFGHFAPLVALAAPVLAAVAYLMVLHEPFDPTRLVVKSMIPMAAALPVMILWRPGRARTTAAVLLSLVATAGVTLSCVAVYGVPLNTTVLVPLLSLGPPDGRSLIVAVALLGGAVAGQRFRGRPDSGLLSPLNLLLSAGEAVYFGGFLLESTRNLGVWSWAIVGSALALASALRGVRPWRSLLGAAAFVAMMEWSGSTYSALISHLALLGCATPFHPSPAGRGEESARR